MASHMYDRYEKCCYIDVIVYTHLGPPSSATLTSQDRGEEIELEVCYSGFRTTAYNAGLPISKTVDRLCC